MDIATAQLHIDTLKEQTQEALITDDAALASTLVAALKANSVSDPEVINDILPKLQFVRLLALSDTQALQLLQQNLHAAFEIPDYDLAEKLLNRIESIEYFPDKVQFTLNLGKVLQSNTATLGSQQLTINNRQVPPTVGSWMADYDQFPARHAIRDEVDRLDYINKSANVKTLTPEERNILLELIGLYDYAKNFVAAWNAVPTPGSEEEAFRNFNLNDYLPIDIRESAADSTPTAVSSAPTPTPPETPRPAPVMPPQQSRSLSSSVSLPDNSGAGSRSLHGQPLQPQSQAPSKNSVDGARIKDLINHPHGGIALDQKTNIEVVKEKARLDAERQKKEQDIQLKLADLRKRNQKP